MTAWVVKIRPVRTISRKLRVHAPCSIPTFTAFSDIVRAMRRKEHLSPEGFERLVRLAYGMNARGKQRSRTLAQVLAGSSETAREAPVTGRAGCG